LPVWADQNCCVAKAGARAGLEWPASYTFLNDDPATRNRFLPSSPPPPLVVHLLRRCHDFLGAAIVLARGFTGDPPRDFDCHHSIISNELSGRVGDTRTGDDREAEHVRLLLRADGIVEAKSECECRSIPPPKQLVPDQKVRTEPRNRPRETYELAKEATGANAREVK
jgi:hypothetical protein